MLKWPRNHAHTVKKKLLGQIYTPPHIVEKILSDTGFYKSEIDGKSILDPACGDGRFLVPIAKHIIQNSSAEALKINLSKVVGWDIDPEALALCRKNLNALVKHLPFKIRWNLKRTDALQEIRTKKRFDFIVGNPPYIRIQHLPETQRKHIQTTYSFCQSGSTDAYVAFFQLASTILNNNGLCGFVTPNSYITSETGLPLRTFFTNNKNLRQITNFGSTRIFENTGTYAAITIFGRGASTDHFKYELYSNPSEFKNRLIHFDELDTGKKWHLSVDIQAQMKGVRLGDLCQISVGLTTLADDLYLFKKEQSNEGISQVINKNGERFNLESTILKPIIKGSKIKSAREAITEYILFPYEKDLTGKNRIISEERLQNHFPLAYSYLLSIKDKLLKRDNGKPNSVSWYAFGRAQGLDTSFGKKIIFSPINKDPNFILCENDESTVYSGYFLKYDGNYDFLLKQLNSERMKEFISVAGRDFQGGYKGYNKKVVENFIVTDSEN